MQTIAVIDLLSLEQYAERRTSFRGRDRTSISDRRRCLKVCAAEEVFFAFDIAADMPRAGTAAVSLAAAIELYDSEAYARKFLNTIIELRVNDRIVFDGVLHWRSHEETAAYWAWFDFSFDAAWLMPGRNTVHLKNKTTRDALGEFFDPQLLKHFDEREAERKLSTMLFSNLEIGFVAPPTKYPRLSGMPDSAVAGSSFIVEVNTGPSERKVDLTGRDNASVTALGGLMELGAWRALFEVTPREPGRAVELSFSVEGTSLDGRVSRVYADRDLDELIAGPGVETVYWHQLKQRVQDFFEEGAGSCLRISIDDFLNNLHAIPAAKWPPLIEYLVRRRRFYALQRLRVPHYSRIQSEDLAKLADLGGSLFAGVSIPEPINSLPRTGEPDLEKRLRQYLETFKRYMKEFRLRGHRLVTFDSAGGLCGHYYRLGLDVHISEVGPACNVYEEACCRGAATAYGKPWGIAAAMLWYYGQGASYACDEARVRLARQVMVSAYLAGARQIVWEGGVFDNIPVYQYVQSEESWRDYFRRGDEPIMRSLRGCFRELLDFHQAQQLPSPRVRFGIVQGVNDVFHGAFDASQATRFFDMSMARAWSLLKVFLPHFCFGRGPVDHGRPHRRWFSATPYGQVDVVPAETPESNFKRYSLLAFTGWNTMTEELYRKLIGFVNGGGTLFLSLPHLTADTMQQLEWTFHNGGDLSELCGVKVSDLGRRIERVHFNTELFARHLPPEFVLSEKNPLFFEDFDEVYPAFSQDVTYFGGELELRGAEVLAVSQRSEPALLRRRIGKGEVFLLNSWFHPGRGRLLPLAEGILRALVERVEQGIRVEDPEQVVAWYEYPEKDYTRYFLLNTNWTQAEGAVDATVSLGAERLALSLRPGVPVQVISDGRLHVVIDDPAAQLVQWRKSGERYDLTALGASDLKRIRCAGCAAGVTVNGQMLP